MIHTHHLRLVGNDRPREGSPPDPPAILHGPDSRECAAQPYRESRMVEFFRDRGDLIVGLIAGTGFGMLMTAALALFLGGRA